MLLLSFYRPLHTPAPFPPFNHHSYQLVIIIIIFILCDPPSDRKRYILLVWIDLCCLLPPISPAFTGVWARFVLPFSTNPRLSLLTLMNRASHCHHLLYRGYGFCRVAVACASVLTNERWLTNQPITHQVIHFLGTRLRQWLWVWSVVWLDIHICACMMVLHNYKYIIYTYFWNTFHCSIIEACVAVDLGLYIRTIAATNDGSSIQLLRIVRFQDNHVE